MNNNYVIFGGQYGSEGKASAAEFWIRQIKTNSDKKIAVIGENSPNSGHTTTLGSTRNIPATSYWADAVILGPDSVIDPDVLLQDWEKVGRPKLYIHENAAVLGKGDKQEELNLVERISSTGSGSGMARKHKFIDRDNAAIVKNHKGWSPSGIKVLDSIQYIDLIRKMQLAKYKFILECSQGVMLDTNFGMFPFVTSRTMLSKSGGRKEWARVY